MNEIYRKLAAPYTQVPYDNTYLATNPFLQGFRQFNYYKPEDYIGAFINTADPTLENIFYNTGSPIDRETALLHEGDHLRTRRSGVDRYKEFGPKRAEKFVNNIQDNADYLLKKYPQLRQIGYFYKNNPEVKNASPSTLFDELVASLVGLELATGKDLTDDPILKKSVFSDPVTAELYRSMTGWRSTRWDARDPAPNTFRKDLLQRYLTDLLK